MDFSAFLRSILCLVNLIVNLAKELTRVLTLVHNQVVYIICILHNSFISKISKISGTTKLALGACLPTYLYILINIFEPKGKVMWRRTCIKREI